MLKTKLAVFGARMVRRSRRNGLTGLACAAAVWGPAAAQTAPPPPPVEQTTLARDAFSSGSLSAGEGALGGDLWQGAESGVLLYLLGQAPDRFAAPSVGEILRRALLTPGAAPEDAPTALSGLKLMALADGGFVTEARSIASLSNAPGGDPWVGRALATADLLDNNLDAACRRNQRLAAGRDAPFWVKLRLLCYAAAGEIDAADLTFSLLRDRGVLTSADAAILNAVVTGAAPSFALQPRNALHLAAMRRLGLPLTNEALGEAGASVLKAVALDQSDMAASSDVRLRAGLRAAAMGVMDAREIAAVYKAASTAPADLATARAALDAHPADPHTDAVVFTALASTTGPAYLRDKAQLIAAVLETADSFERAYAGAVAYDAEITALEGALLSPGEAAAFAGARMLIGDGRGAARWLYAMLAGRDVGALERADAMRLIELASFLTILDPVAAASIADAAGVGLDDGRARAAGLAGASGNEALAVDAQSAVRLVDAALDAAVRDIAGQAALAALAASPMALAGDPLAVVIVEHALAAAGLERLGRRLEFETAYRGRFFGASTPAPAGPPASRGFVPRKKPARN